MIDPTAIILPGAEIDEGVDVGPYTVIEGGVYIGKGTKIGSRVYIYGGSVIGKDCKLYPGAVIGAPPQHFAFRNERSFVVIGDRVTIRELVTVHRATGEGEKTEIGDDSYLMVGSHVGHNCKVGKNVVLSNLVGLSGYVQIEDGVVIGGMAGVHQFVRIGEYVMVGGLTKVTKDIPPYLLVDGHPARIYGLNIVGLKRNNFNLEERERIKHVYKMIYRSKKKLAEAVEDVEKKYRGIEDVMKIVRFFNGSKRGILRWRVE